LSSISVNPNYLSFEDIKIAHNFNIAVLSGEDGIESIKNLARALNDLYKEGE